jgi:hypothetical protein
MADQETKIPPSRYNPTYRSAEVRLICQSVLRGDSLGFVGIAGVGKSNLINFFTQNSATKAQYLGPTAGNAFFPLVDITAWDRTPLGLWNMMLRALSTLAPDDLPPQARPIRLITEQQQLLRLRQCLAHLCQKLGHPVMFIVDDSDALFGVGPLSMIEELARLRNEGNRNLLTYLIFTKRLPHILGRQHNLEQHSKFYDFIRHSLYALQPYNDQDALKMLQHLNERAGKRLRWADLLSIYTLAGGHAQLLRTIFDVRLRDGDFGPEPAQYLAAQNDVYQECFRIFRSLHAHEQEVALRFARNQNGPEDWDVIDHLIRRGLITNLNPPTWFSAVMQRWLAGYTGTVQE